MSLPNDDFIQELSGHRTFTAADQARIQAWLEAHPDAALDWQEERALTGLLSQAPPAPISSNFTSQVLLAVRRERNRSGRSTPRPWWLILRSHPILAPALALTLVAAGISLTLLRYQSAHRMQMTRSVAQFSTVAALLSASVSASGSGHASPSHIAAGPIEDSIQVLRDFEIISKLRAEPQVDTELLAVLK